MGTPDKPVTAGAAMRFALISALAVAAMPVAAQDLALELPAGAIETARATPGRSGFSLPVAPYSNGNLDVQSIDGPVQTVAWRFPLGDANTATLIEFFRGQIGAAGYKPLLDCADRRCGGFDFRFQLDLLPEPDMHVDLGDFRFLSAERQTEAGPEYLQLVLSRSPANGYLELTQIGIAARPQIVTSTKSPDAAAVPGRADGAVGDFLDNGFAALTDLTFATGSSNLTDVHFASLDLLASEMQQNPDLTIALVGHTDAVGSLAANIALSRQRAQSVMDRLSSQYGVPRSRMEAQGVGYLSPVASNLTPAGRAQNRRVEVIITSTR